MYEKATKTKGFCVIPTKKRKKTQRKRRMITMTQVFTEVLNKDELINGYRDATGKKKNESKEVLESVFSYLEDILYVQKKGFKLGDIGTVKLKIEPEREHGVPKSDEKVVKPKHYKSTFKVNDGFKRDLAALEVEEG